MTSYLTHSMQEIQSYNSQDGTVHYVHGRSEMIAIYTVMPFPPHTVM